MTLGEAAAVFLERLKSRGPRLKGKRSNRKRITESSVHYREQTVRALLKSWPELATKDVRKISGADCEKWSEGFATRYSATRYNGTLDSLRHVIEVAVKAGARHGNPADAIGRRDWTLEMLSDRLVALGCVESFSEEAVRRALKKTIFSPGGTSSGPFPRQGRSSSGAGKR